MQKMLGNKPMKDVIIDSYRYVKAAIGGANVQKAFSLEAVAVLHHLAHDRVVDRFKTAATEAGLRGSTMIDVKDCLTSDYRRGFLTKAQYDEKVKRYLDTKEMYRKARELDANGGRAKRRTPDQPTIPEIDVPNLLEAIVEQLQEEKPDIGDIDVD